MNCTLFGAIFSFIIKEIRDAISQQIRIYVCSTSKAEVQISLPAKTSRYKLDNFWKHNGKH